MLLEPADALFEEAWLIHQEVREDLIERVTVGVDPSVGADAVGIVVAALLNDGRLAVLADRATGGTPAQWGDAVVRASDDFEPTTSRSTLTTVERWRLKSSGKPPIAPTRRDADRPT
jgi:phage terminase large subunit-like protein